MTKVVLLEKVYGQNRPEDFTPALLTLCSGLEVEVKVVGTAGRGWLVVEVFGEDEHVALELLKEEMGLAPVRPDGVKRFSTIRGKTLSVRPNGLLVDVGIFEPFNLDAFLPLRTLRAQLADGLDMDMDKLASLLGLCEGLPLEVKLLEEPSGEAGRPIEAELSEGQVRAFEDWVFTGLDRLVITGASHHAVKKAVGGSGFYKQVVAIERLGFLENCVVLKLGASTKRIFRALRRRLSGANIMVFRPRAIIEALPGRFRSSGF